MRRWLLIVPFVVACGGSSPVGPGPSSITLSGTLTDTVSGAPLGTYTQTVASLPALLSLSAPGHLARTARVTAQGQAVDLIPEAAPFDLEFYRQFVRGTLEGPALPVRVLSVAPSIYLQTTGLSAQTVASMELAARAAVPAFTGDRFQVQRWEAGEDVRPELVGWIVVEMVREPGTGTCGRSYVGAAAGHIWINLSQLCNRSATIAHELGHALGFEHISRTDGLMSSPHAFNVTAPSAIERYHAAIAYTRTAGNRDPDIDP